MPRKIAESNCYREVVGGWPAAEQEQGLREPALAKALGVNYGELC
jgi:hypothetical protein